MLFTRRDMVYNKGMERKKIGILGGTLGLHNFYLGNSQRGLIQILVATLGAALTCGISTVAMMIWGIVEGVQILEHKINADGNGIKLKD